MALSSARSLLFGGASLLAVGALTMAGGARAQTAPPVPPSASATDSQPDDMSKDIVVTAQRRSENLSQVPISISVVSDAKLTSAGVHDVAGLTKVVPGFTMTFAGADSEPNIRGIGTQVSGPGFPSNVAIYQDGFYQPNVVANNVEFPDIVNVQVLKGPQGELYGQNATGGAVLISTRDPEFQPSADITASYRSFNEFRGSVFATAPLVDDTLAASLTAYLRTGDGYEKNIVSGNDGLRYHQIAVRGKLLFTPSSNVKIVATVQHYDTNNPNYYTYSAYNGWAIAALIGGTVATKPYEYSMDFPPTFRSYMTDISLRAEVKFPWATLTSLSHVQWQNNDSAFDVDLSSLPLVHISFPGTDKNMSQEFDLASNGSGPLQWLGGVFLYQDIGADDFDLLTPPGPFRILSGRLKVNTVAVFGDVTYGIADKLFLTAGLRYSNDWYRGTFENAANGYLPQSKSSQSHAFTPRAVVRYQFSPSTSVYASYSRGFKSGGYNVNGGYADPVVKPEHIAATEVGFKTGGRGWHLEGAAYYYKYSDLQVNIYNGPTNTLLNAARATVYGGELSGSLSVTPSLSIDGGLSLNHARYSDFPDAPFYTFDPVIGIPNPPPSKQAKGNPLEGSPDVSIKGGVTYRRELPFGTVTLSGNVTYQSTIYYDLFEQMKQKPTTLLALRATYTDPSKRVDVSIFSENVTDQKYFNVGIQQPTGFFELWAPPRTVGVEVKLHI